MQPTPQASAAPSDASATSAPQQPTGQLSKAMAADFTAVALSTHNAQLSDGVKFENLLQDPCEQQQSASEMLRQTSEQQQSADQILHQSVDHQQSAGEVLPQRCTARRRGRRSVAEQHQRNKGLQSGKQAGQWCGATVYQLCLGAPSSSSSMSKQVLANHTLAKCRMH